MCDVIFLLSTQESLWITWNHKPGLLACRSGTASEGYLLRKVGRCDGSTGECEFEGHNASKLEGKYSQWFPQVFSYLGWKVVLAGRNDASHLFSLGKSSRDPSPSSTHSEISK